MHIDFIKAPALVQSWRMYRHASNGMNLQTFCQKVTTDEMYVKHVFVSRLAANAFLFRHIVKNEGKSCVTESNHSWPTDFSQRHVAIRVESICYEPFKQQSDTGIKRKAALGV